MVRVDGRRCRRQPTAAARTLSASGDAHVRAATAWLWAKIAMRSSEESEGKEEEEDDEECSGVDQSGADEEGG